MGNHVLYVNCLKMTLIINSSRVTLSSKKASVLVRLFKYVLSTSNSLGHVPLCRPCSVKVSCPSRMNPQHIHESKELKLMLKRTLLYFAEKWDCGKFQTKSRVGRLELKFPTSDLKAFRSVVRHSKM